MPKDYFPQIEVSGKDILELAKKEPEYDTNPLHILMGERGDKFLIYAQPNSEGMLIIDGSKYENIGLSQRHNNLVLYNYLEYKGKRRRQSLGDMFYNHKIEYMIKDYVSTIIADKVAKDPAYRANEIIAKEMCEEYSIYGQSFIINPMTTDLIITEGVKNIGYKACYGCNINHLTLPETLRKIEEEAFALCQMKKISVPDNIFIEKNAFYGCANLKTVNFEGNAKVEPNAFGKCPHLKNLVIPQEVEEEKEFTLR